MKIEQIELREVQMPLISFFETSFGRTTLRRVILVRVFGEGLVGYGESTAPEGPFYNHESTATAWHVLQDWVIPRVFAAEIAHPRDVAPLLRPIRGHNMAKAAVETAIWDLYARLQGKPLHELLGGQRKTLDCGVSIGIQETPGKLLEKIEKELLGGLPADQDEDQAGVGRGRGEGSPKALPRDPADVRCQFGLQPGRPGSPEGSG